MPVPSVTAVVPARAIEGGRVAIHGSDLPIDQLQAPGVQIGDQPARVVCASSTRVEVLVPAGLAESGPLPIRVAGVPGQTVFLVVAAPVATGLHQVDNPVFDAEGNLYVTYSGSRGQQVPVSIFRVRPNGARETFSSGIVNATSIAIDPQGRLHASSRFEGTVYRLDTDGNAQPFATDLGVPCGLAFAPDGTLFVGDRSGTIFKVDPLGRATPFASLPPSVAAFHLALGSDASLYVSAPTLGCSDAVRRIAANGTISTLDHRFGRPQGLAFDAAGTLFVVEALAGESGLFRLPPGREPELVLSGPGLVGVAFDPHGGFVICSNDSAYRFPRPD